ncbi:DivIVA domain-containing protein [Micromonospora sp. NPDC005113]
MTTRPQEKHRLAGLAPGRQIERARGSLPAAMHGYDRAQVDAFLDDLSDALARWDDDKREAG